MEDQWPVQLENCRVASPAGELDVATALDFAFLLRGTASKAGADWLIVDLRRVSFMGCSPLHDLCTAWDRSRATGRWTRVVYDQASIGRLLRLTSLQERFPRYASIDAAWRERFAGVST
ncbi:STAS domain-containing protein [Streptomyces sp. NBC_01142]|uniref:STAS domain-containing protein n=1 Tax=Streptomyces sp. NBC_01142 TaxID=2975865 RepID=UPI00225214E6|nr:STAS domain-containing protein [Streptomyces sp. NBC_01142]MCX4821612.1 STAS domain-containing protein [Streptomyces sp. NBC_01142]